MKKIVVLYQVIMHYRLPFYEKICAEENWDAEIWYGNGVKGTKLINTTASLSNINLLELKDIRLRFNNKIGMPFTPSLFLKLIQSSPDIIFTEGSSSLINSFIAFIYAKVFKKKFVWWSLGKLEDKEYTGFRKLVNKLENYIEIKADAIFTYSNKGKDYFISRGVNPNNIHVGVNVLDTNKKLTENNLQNKLGSIHNNKTYNIGFIGSVTKEKKLDILIGTLKNLIVDNCNITLHIIGDGEYLNNIIKYADDLNIKDNIIFHGRLNSGSSQILSNCQLFVLPGLGGLAICDGMINGLPIITGKADGTEYDLVDYKNGFIINDMNQETLYEKIYFLYKNPMIGMKMGEESFKRITNELHFDKYFNVFKQLINSL